MTTVQFTIPRTVGDALPLERIVVRARAAGVPDARLEYNGVHAGVGKMRITCSVDMAVYLIDHLRQLADRSAGNDTRLVIDCTYAVKAAFDAIDHEIYGPGGRPVPGIHTSVN